MSPLEHLRARLGDAAAPSFLLMGEALVLLPPDEAALAEVPGELRGELRRAQLAILDEAYAWLERYNRSLGGRVRGYLALGRKLGLAYPWPVVAVLGICQVIDGLTRNRMWGLLGGVAARAGFRPLAHLVDTTDDVLRRTNRGIFADSVPTVLYALAADAHRRRGETRLADALVEGPLPPCMDEESRALLRGLYQGLALPRGQARFATLADLTLRHFGREQAIFSHHLGPPDGRPPPRLARLTEVPAPRVERGRLVFRPYRLPEGFDMRDHAARVRAFGEAFVRSITGSIADYRVAAAYAYRRFARGDAPPVRFDDF